MFPKARPSKSSSRLASVASQNSLAIDRLWSPHAIRNSPPGPRRSIPAMKLLFFRRSAAAEATMSTSSNESSHPDLILLVHEPIDASALIRHVRGAGDGAIVTFDGCVRNQSHGR